jgi:hypothetical protein
VWPRFIRRYLFYPAELVQLGERRSFTKRLTVREAWLNFRHLLPVSTTKRWPTELVGYPVVTETFDEW